VRQEGEAASHGAAQLLKYQHHGADELLRKSKKTKGEKADAGTQAVAGRRRVGGGPDRCMQCR